MYAHKNLTGTGQGMAQQRANAKRVMLSNTDDMVKVSLRLIFTSLRYQFVFIHNTYIYIYIFLSRLEICEC